jgi:hypothetical protein
MPDSLGTSPIISPTVPLAVAPGRIPDAVAANLVATLDPDLEDMAQAMMATGLSHWQAMVNLHDSGLALASCPSLGLAPRAELYAFTGFEDMWIVLHKLAKRNPDGANALLNAYLEVEGRPLNRDLDLSDCDYVMNLPAGLDVRGRLYLLGGKLTALPEGLRVGGTCCLSWTNLTALPEGFMVPGGDLELFGVPLTALPRGLVVGGYLELSESRLDALPEGLKVKGDLDLRACRTWNHKIPADAEVGGLVRTDHHPGGLPLAEWRLAYPQGQPFYEPATQVR